MTLCIEKNLGFSTSKKGLSLFMEAKKKYENEGIAIPNWISQVIEKIKSLPLETSSILRMNP